MSKICTIRYNPYSNRDKKGFASWNEYQVYNATVFNGINFNPADGINTELILGGPMAQTVDTSADYLLVGTDSDTPVIESRWFILDCDRTRSGQYKIRLYRDVIYDNLSSVLNAKAFIEKGWITSLSSPFLFNQEGITTNQIKQSETLLKDTTNTPWIIGYLSKDFIGQQVGWSGAQTDAIDVDEETFIKLRDNTFYDLNYSQSVLNTIYPVTDLLISNYTDTNNNYLGVKFSKSTTGSASRAEDIIVSKNIGENHNTPFYFAGSSLSAKETSALNFATNEFKPLHDNNRSVFEAAVKKSLASYAPYSQNNYSDVSRYAYSYIAYNGKCYNVARADLGNQAVQFSLRSEFLESRSWKELVVNAINSSTYIDQTQPQIEVEDYDAFVTAQVHAYKFSLIELDYNDYYATIPSSVSRLTLNSQPYSMFCMPYNDFYYSDNGVNATLIKGDVSLKIAQGLSAAYTGDTTLIDLQLLPYCPVQDKLGYVDGHYCVNNAKTGQKLQAIPVTQTDTQTVVSYIIFCEKDTFTFSLFTQLYNYPVTTTEFKKQNQARKCRLISPNGASMYDFNPLMLGYRDHAELTTLRVRCTYKPYNPYIQILPINNSNSLYGSQFFEDSNGLICQGDFSMPQVNDGWLTYQRNNKNYLNAFNRQIESVELNNKYAKAKDIMGIASSTAKGAVSAVVGGVMGGVAGAVTGGLSTAINLGAGIANAVMDDTLRQDQLDLQKDLFNYNLENIQARTTTVSKIGANDIGNKLWPYLEVYDCSASEKTAIENKIKYNGMSIGVIDTVSAYAVSGHFIQADLIHIDLHEDWHMINTIKEELKTGFYYGGVT